MQPRFVRTHNREMSNPAMYLCAGLRHNVGCSNVKTPGTSKPDNLTLDVLDHVLPARQESNLTP